MIPSRRNVIIGSGALLAAGSARAQDHAGLLLTGRFAQGGHAIGRTWPRAPTYVDGESRTAASGDGWDIVGIHRDAAGSVQIEARLNDRTASRTLDIARGQFPSTRIDGLPPSTVEPSDPELLARIRREVVLKTEGFASRTDADHFHEGFDWPLEGFRVTSRWGSQRVLNGTPARPHYGIDLAAPQGTAIRAPAPGRVTLATSGLHFEGGLVLIDHGQGLVSAYLHQSRIEVAAGQELRRGETIGRVGMTGRATGPHLCWRLKWRDRNLDPSLLVKT